eukprot:TRINITY_DN797_c0_g1_i1.p1 TRINITY_DN797_c0_g1~~TRINITY_DN797_c0_g1_i1.p1  ORF type:complete len:209 (+),score=27.74 TRINITY_DN797_c0_g1_i1:304-930(+)
MSSPTNPLCSSRRQSISKLASNEILSPINGDRGKMEDLVSLCRMKEPHVSVQETEKYLVQYHSLLEHITSFYDAFFSEVDSYCQKTAEDFSSWDGFMHYREDSDSSSSSKGKRYFGGDSDYEDYPRKRRKGKLPDCSTEVLKKWLYEHLEYPYPTDQEKLDLCTKANLTLSQIANWFINARRRVLSPMNLLNPKGKVKENSSPQQLQL